MKPEDVYKLAPEQVDEDMLEAAKGFDMPSYASGGKGELEDARHNAETLLEVAQRYFRLGAFEMEHKDGTRCGFISEPPCGHAAEVFVLGKYVKEGLRLPVYCKAHADKLLLTKMVAPIYENPHRETSSEARCVGCGEFRTICCSSWRTLGADGKHVDPRCAECCNHRG